MQCGFGFVALIVHPQRGHLFMGAFDYGEQQWAACGGHGRPGRQRHEWQSGLSLLKCLERGRITLGADKSY